MVSLDDFRTFIEKAKASGGAEMANCQPFIERLCRFLSLPEPDLATEQNHRNDYVYERRIEFKHPDGSRSPGRIDLYKRGHFILEAKQSAKRAKTEVVDQHGLFPEDMLQTKAGQAKRGTRNWDKVMIAAKKQAEDYARALPVDHGYPPFILVLDIGNVLEVYADFSGQGKNYAHFPDRQSYRITMDDLLGSTIQERLRAIWTDPLSLDPIRKSAEVTRDIAERLAKIARRLEGRYKAQDVAEFLMRCVFTMFAEDVRLLPEDSFKNLLGDMVKRPKDFVPALEDLWDRMDKGGYDRGLGATIKRFNGSLFKNAKALPLDADDINEIWIAAKRDWQDVEPAIFGTLVERALDSRERSKLGAHYTPRTYVERLVIPTIIEPLRADWDAVSALINDLLEEGKKVEALRAAKKFHRQLCTTRVLDPACGTGNFLYVALELMKRLEGEVLETIASLGGAPDRYSDFPDQAQGRVGRMLAKTGGTFTVDPHQFYGLELNPRAATIADLVLWIGYLKWQIKTGGTDAVKEPVLDAYGTIVCQDAILVYDSAEPVMGEDGKPLTRWDGVTKKIDPITGAEVPDPTATKPVLRYHNFRKAPWPDAEFIVGNPPFVAGKDMRIELGDEYAEAVWKARPGVPGGADFVMHFWDEAAEYLLAKVTVAKPNPLRRFGFITTNSLTQTFSRKVIAQRMVGKTPLSLIYAIPDHPWLKASDKAAVRIAMTVAVAGETEGILAEVVREEGLNTDTPTVELATRIGHIKPALTIGADLTKAKPLWANRDLAHQGFKPYGLAFWVDKASARRFGLGRIESSERYIRPYLNGRDLNQTPRGRYVLDFHGLSAEEVRERFPDAYQHLRAHSKPVRDQDKMRYRRENWWRFGQPSTEMRDALNGLDRFIGTTETAAHRIFSFIPGSVAPDQKIRVVASGSALLLAILSSRIHVHFSISNGGWQGAGNDPVYQHTNTFDPFPFPDLKGMDSGLPERLTSLGEKVDSFRKKRIAAHPHLTMTALYNTLERVREVSAGVVVEPLTDEERDIYDAGHIGILGDLHDEIDRAVLDAYGWPDLAPALVGRPGTTIPSPHKTPAQEAAEEEVLVRLVALNQARVADGARGEIEWLRPEYQVPHLRNKAPQPDRAKQIAADLGGPTEGAAQALPWPSDGLDQIRAVRTILATATTPLAPEDIARRFRGGRNRAARVETVLRHMVETGMVRANGRSHFLPR